MESVKAKGPEIQIVMFTVHDKQFATDIQKVKDIIRVPDITKIHNAQEFIKGLINLRGKIVVVIDLGIKLGMEPVEIKKASRIIIIEIKDDVIGFLVDSVSEVVNIRASDIQPKPESLGFQANLECVKGVYIKGKELLMIVDADKILNAGDYENG